LRLCVQEWIFGKTVCRLFYATTALNWFASVFTLTVLSADRYAAVCHAVASAPYRTPKLALTVSAAVWLLCLAVVTPIYLFATTVCLIDYLSLPEDNVMIITSSHCLRLCVCLKGITQNLIFMDELE